VTSDIAVVGAGPAGSAVATLLARRGHRVVLFERSRFEAPRIGETFGGELEPLLKALGAWEAFAAMASLPFRAVRSAWGTSELTERSSMTHPFGDGFHVERARFDNLLADVAEGAGASVCTGAGWCKVETCGGGFSVTPRHGTAVHARFLVDASGRGAPATALLSDRRRWLSFDQMVAVVATLTTASDEPDLLIETSEDGWWYSAPQPDGSLVAALMTDGDLTPAGRRGALTERWRAALARTRHTARRFRNASLTGAIRIVRAECGLLFSSRGPGFYAVGDAAMAFDPIAGNGVARALRSAVDAAVEIDAALGGSTAAESAPIGRFVEDLDRRARYYLLESRWPDAPFWVRRRPPDWATESITLAPSALLRWNGSPPNRDALSRAESLLPRRAIVATLHRLRTPQPAHTALRVLRDHAPLGDRRLLVGLQLLVEHGLLESARLGPLQPIGAVT
jgi:flavin-dependent dehydrogenase